MYEAIFPRLHPHQQVLLVPGLFGCSPEDSKEMCPWNHGSWNTSRRLEGQGWAMLQKLKGYWEWAKVSSARPCPSGNRGRTPEQPCSRVLADFF